MSRATPAERRDALLAFGRTHFAESGFNASTMAQIAAKAGVSKALLYHYFGGRRAFYMAVVNDVIDGLIEATDPGDAQGLDAVLNMATGFVRYGGAHAAICRVITRGGLGSDAEVNEQLDRLRHSTMRRILAALGRKAPGPVAQLALPGMVGFFESVTVQWLEDQALPEADVVAIIVRGFQSLFGLVLEDTHAV